MTKYSASFTCCVNNQSEEVSSRGCEVYPLDGAPVVGAVIQSHVGHDQGAIASQVNSSRIRAFVGDFHVSGTIHSGHPRPCGFSCIASTRGAVRPIQGLECTVQFNDI